MEDIINSENKSWQMNKISKRITNYISISHDSNYNK